MDEAQQLIGEIQQKFDRLKELLSFQENWSEEVEQSESPSVEPPAEPRQPGKPQKIFQMFPSNSGDDLDELGEAVNEAGSESADENDEDSEDDFDELDGDDLDEIDEDLDDEESDEDQCEDSVVSDVLKCVAAANRFNGVSIDDIGKKVDCPKYKLIKLVKELFLNNQIEKVHLRPATYRSIVE